MENCISQEGVVKEVKNSEVIIEMTPKEACSKCCSCSAAGKQYLTVTGEGARGLAAGERVVVEIPSVSMMRVYLLLYAVPLLAFFASLLLLYYFLKSPLTSFAGAMFIMVIFWLISGKIIKAKYDVRPEVRKI